MGESRPRSFYFLAAFFIAYVLFLYGPMFAIYVLSFQGPDGGLTFPMNGLSLTWFGKVFSGTGIVDIGAAFKRSLELGLVVAAERYDRVPIGQELVDEVRKVLGRHGLF